ncbi:MULTISPECIES: GDP-mannose 4,6-dehydratase [unclassified Caulobacter]|uniref:GDP-mannose 4,6-dehydratase n=1 Tax=unclassified Caulobacter TaxID=2648921 RepID=UPI000D390673|nr:MULTISPECIES: GDP-mannose 4,6-dehydratase [unclassified Caulobacter]PTS84214.1 GDP-mannose 4,6-dehydratase [Caulobacter sp. HMWF009]PTT09793.1 GDP-mannose 4,6-dehydratase [Caulobacter sp. HMWF025]
MTRALVCGVSGQDGAYLSKLLVDKGYEVVGVSRDAEMSRFEHLARLGVRDRMTFRSMTLNDFRSVLQVLAEVEPDEIYNLAGQSSVGLSFNQPVETMESIALGTLNLLEAMRFLKLPGRLYNAASGDCFGQTTREAPATEDSPLRPRSPYGVAKSAAFWEVANYREAYGLFACSGLLFNHESPLRPARFVTRKVVRTACRIAQGSGERLQIGDIRVVRDWGWAPEYVDAMWRMLQSDTPRDYVIATGESCRLEDFIAAAFAENGLDWKDHTDVDESLFRATDIMTSYADASRAERELGWVAQTRVPQMVKELVRVERETLA